MIHNIDFIYDTSKDALIKELIENGYPVETNDEFSEIVVPMFLFTRIAKDKSKAFHDILMEPYYVQTEYGQVLKRKRVRIWNQEGILKFMKSGWVTNS